MLLGLVLATSGTVAAQEAPPNAIAIPPWFAETFLDFREDVPHVTVPALILHGDADGIVPLEGSGTRTHAAITGSELHVIAGGPHGCNVSHADEFNRVLLGFLAR